MKVLHECVDIHSLNVYTCDKVTKECMRKIKGILQAKDI